MNKSTIIGIVVLLVVLVGGGVALAKHKSTDNVPNTQGSASTDTALSDSATATTSVSIANMAFSPANIKVKIGDTVTWTNNDTIAHTVTETDGQNGPKSQDIQPGKSFVFTYDAAGTYKYHCSIHPQMTGSVSVSAR